MHTLLMENRTPSVIGFSLTHGSKRRSVQDTKLSLFTSAEEKTIPCLPVKKKKKTRVFAQNLCYMGYGRRIWVRRQF